MPASEASCAPPASSTSAGPTANQPLPIATQTRFPELRPRTREP